jgi:lysozyme
VYLLADLSNNNPAVDLAKLAASRMVAGVYHKATEHDAFVDAFFSDRRREAARLGLRFGPYHFARPDRDPTTRGARLEAQHFCDIVGKLGRRDLRPALDYETRADVDNLAWIVQFNSVVKKSLGVWPLFYSYLSLIEELRLPRPVGDGLWLSMFGSDNGADHGFQTPAPWQHVAGHQFTSAGFLPGVVGHVDLTHAASLVPFLAHPWLGRL